MQTFTLCLNPSSNIHNKCAEFTCLERIFCDNQGSADAKIFFLMLLTMLELEGGSKITLHTQMVAHLCTNKVQGCFWRHISEVKGNPIQIMLITSISGFISSLCQYMATLFHQSLDLGKYQVLSPATGELFKFFIS